MAAQGGQFAHEILSWYDRRRRDMPWRTDATPYKTLVSETMLQQTQVKTVIPYFNRFIDKLPGFNELADASEEDVLSLWSGLGYYRRARQLHQLAKDVTQRYEGALPTSVGELEKLPGVGSYTARAVASIAFGKPVGVVDGNVKRVAARLQTIDADVSSAKVTAQIQAWVDKLVPHDRPGDFNQAIMELGATVCTPRNPQCNACPVATHCQGLQQGSHLSLPKKKPKPETVAIDGWACLVLNKNRLFLVEDPPKPFFKQGIYELPIFVSPKKEDANSAKNWFEQRYKFHTNLHATLKPLRHAITKHRIYLQTVLLETDQMPASGKWIKWTNAADQPISGLCIKALQLLAIEMEPRQLRC